MMPTRAEAEKILEGAERCNSGPWVKHSRITAQCAEKIAELCENLDSEKAYILGLLHDIGRKFGVRFLGHVSDGYTYMMLLGYDEVAKICLTHSFNNSTIKEYIGKFDVSDEELELIKTALSKVNMDDYDKLIQLCDALSGSDSVLNIEDRMSEVKQRYGYYPQEKWNSNIRLKNYFEKKTGKDIYEIVHQQQT